MEAPSWSFTALLGIRTRKHAGAVYVPGELRPDPTRSYRHGSTVRLAEGTGFDRLVRAIAGGKVSYDPGIKLEGASGPEPAFKRRSQFRVGPRDLACLYHRMTEHDLRPS